MKVESEWLSPVHNEYPKQERDDPSRTLPYYGQGWGRQDRGRPFRERQNKHTILLLKINLCGSDEPKSS